MDYDDDWLREFVSLPYDLRRLLKTDGSMGRRSEVLEHLIDEMQLQHGPLDFSWEVLDDVLDGFKRASANQWPASTAAEIASAVLGTMGAPQALGTLLEFRWDDQIPASTVSGLEDHLRGLLQRRLQAALQGTLDRWFGTGRGPDRQAYRDRRRDERQKY